MIRRRNPAPPCSGAQTTVVESEGALDIRVVGGNGVRDDPDFDYLNRHRTHVLTMTYLEGTWSIMELLEVAAGIPTELEPELP